jgi:choline dehydrogenase
VHDVPHGDLVGRLLGPVVEFNVPGTPERFARIARALGKDTRNKTVNQAADLAVEEVYALTEDVEIPTLQSLGFSTDEVPMLAKIAFDDPQTVGNPRELDVGSYEEIWKRAFGTGKG